MHGFGDTAPRPLDPFAEDTGWGELGDSGAMAVLSDTLIQALGALDVPNGPPDLLETVACSLRLQEPVLLTIAVDGWVWPVSLYPRHGLYRAPVDWLRAPPAALWGARLLACEPPPALPPAAGQQAFPPCHYPLGGLLWSLALLGPRNGLLRDLAGCESFRVLEPARRSVVPGLPGALGSAVARLRTAPADFATICRWPGLDAMRTARLLNGLYLEGSLVTEHGPLELQAGDASWKDTLPSRWPAPPRGLWPGRVRRTGPWHGP